MHADRYPADGAHRLLAPATIGADPSVGHSHELARLSQHDRIAYMEARSPS
jgi:hypothetical protein